MDGIYLKTDRLYEPVQDKCGKIHAFRELSRYITRLSADEQQMIYRHTVGGMGMPMERLERLESMDCNDAVRKLVARVRDKLNDIPTLECNRLIADIYAVGYGWLDSEAYREHFGESGQSSPYFPYVEQYHVRYQKANGKRGTMGISPQDFDALYARTEQALREGLLKNEPEKQDFASER